MPHLNIENRDNRVGVALALVVLLLGPSAASAASSCSSAIPRLQAEVDTKIDTWAGSGRAGRESVAAMQRHQPTPKSVARAEARVGDGSQGVEALRQLQRAR